MGNLSEVSLIKLKSLRNELSCLLVRSDLSSELLEARSSLLRLKIIMAFRSAYKVYDIYCISDGTAAKIGVAGFPNTRRKYLQVGNPRELVLVDSFPVSSKRKALDLECSFRDEFAGLHVRAEWFGLKAIEAFSVFKSQNKEIDDV